jgi:hypothetical protein
VHARPNTCVHRLICRTRRLGRSRTPRGPALCSSLVHTGPGWMLSSLGGDKTGWPLTAGRLGWGRGQGKSGMGLTARAETRGLRAMIAASVWAVPPSTGPGAAGPEVGSGGGRW